MAPDRKPARAQAEGALRQQLAAQVTIGAHLSGLPPVVLRQMAALMVREGGEPLGAAEGRLLAVVRIAERRPDLQDPAAVDLSDPATQEAGRQLAEVWEWLDAQGRAFAAAIGQEAGQ